jgi:hypothetical protein
MPAIWEAATEPALEFIPAPAPEERIRLCALLAAKMLREARRKGFRAEMDIACDRWLRGTIDVHVWDGENLWAFDICPRRLSYGKKQFRMDSGWIRDGAGRRCVTCGSETGSAPCDRCFPRSR